MCRLAAYLGPPLLLQHFLADPPHSLIRQSWAPEEMDEAALNADGFGLGWYPEPARPATYLSTLPIWSDINLAGLSASLSSPLWMGNVRSATPGQMTGLANTQPFVANHLLFMHNGLIRNFNPVARTRFHEYLSPPIQAGINGNTDSEYLFAILRQQLSEQPGRDLPAQLIEATHQIASLVKDGTALLNIIVSDGENLYAVRHAINGSCPTLYFAPKGTVFPDATVIASERLTQSPDWQPLPEHNLMVITAATGPEFIAL